MDSSPVPTQFNLVVRDLEATLAFYRLLGWEIETPTGAPHAVVQFSNGITVEFDGTQFVAVWDTGFDGKTGGSTVLGLTVADRAEVDAVYGRLTGAGHHGRQPPYDTFWGSRYAIVNDPDGNPVGFMSPSEHDRRFWPPVDPPRALQS